MGVQTVENFDHLDSSELSRPAETMPLPIGRQAPSLRQEYLGVQMRQRPYGTTLVFLRVRLHLFPSARSIHQVESPHRPRKSLGC